LHSIANAFRFFGMFMAITGLIVLSGSAVWYGTALRTTGERIGTVRDQAGNEKVVVRFTDETGEQHDVEVGRAARNVSSEGSRKLELLYHQENPRRVVVNTFFDKWFVGGFLLVWGAFIWWILTAVAKRLSRNNNGAIPNDRFGR